MLEIYMLNKSALEKYHTAALTDFSETYYLAHANTFLNN